MIQGFYEGLEIVNKKWHPLAWEIARCAPIRPSEGPAGLICAWHTLCTGEKVRGCGYTSNEAAQALATKLTAWADHKIAVDKYR